MSLKEIDELIKQMDYNKALAELKIYIEAYPDQFDFAQSRIDKVFRSRNSYTYLANQLLDVMEKEPENAEKKLKIIAELEALEKNPSEEHLAFIRQAKSAAQFTFFRSQFRKKLDEGNAFVEKGDYTQAVAAVREGFYMYRDEFYDEYPSSVTRPVTEIVNEIDTISQSYTNIQNRLTNAYNDFIAAVKNDTYNENLTRAYTAFSREMNSFARVRNNMASSGWRLQEQFERLKSQNPDLTEASYISFVWHFTLGRADDPDSGILGAMDAQWNTMVEASKIAVADSIARQTQGVINVIPEKDLFTKDILVSQAKVRDITNYSNLGKNVNGFYALLQNRDNTTKANTAPLYVDSMTEVANLISGLNTAVSLLSTYKNQKAQADLLVKPTNLVDSIRGTNQFPRQKIEFISLFENYKSSSDLALADSWFTTYNTNYVAQQELKSEDNKTVVARTDAGVEIKNELLDWTKPVSTYEMLNTKISESSNSSAFALWKDVALYFADSGKDLINTYTSGYTYANTLFNGITETTTEAENPQKLAPGKYPREASQTILGIQGTISSDVGLLTNGLNTMVSALSYRTSYQTEEQSVRDSIDYLNSLRTQGNDLLAAAQEEMVLAQSALDEAELRYRQATIAYRNENFDTARRNLQTARDRYGESLAHQEDNALRTRSDTALATLGQEINESENRVIVAEVRTLKTRAKNEYYNGNFEEAEKLLSRAKTRWSVTNVEEDQEITNLMALVGTALSMTSGRVIPPTAPLYPEMSQLLSIAHQYFDEGERILKTDREKAVTLLQQAKTKLQEVQTVYPINQEASLLTLRIDELIDPTSFNEMFQRKIQSARNNYKNPSEQQTVYTDLLDLSEIRPNYPGLKDLIYQVGIEIGVIAKPVDRKALAQSTQLTTEAQRIVNSAGNNEVRLREALSKVDQAIELNPSNNAAQLLKDRIQISIGGKASVVLSSADEARYKQAIQELQKNNIIGAYAIVEQLLQNPSNQRSAKVLDLQKKVRALL